MGRNTISMSDKDDKTLLTAGADEAEASALHWGHGNPNRTMSRFTRVKEDDKNPTAAISRSDNVLRKRSAEDVRKFGNPSAPLTP